MDFLTITKTYRDLKKLLGFDPTKTSVKTEIIAGVTTFLTMSYILAVNPSMFGQLGGMPGGAVFTSTALLALIGILVTMIIGIPMGVTEFQGVLSSPESIKPIFCQFEFENIFSLDMLVVVFTFLFIDMFDTVGTLVGVCTKAKMVDEKGNIYRLKQAFMADAIATTFGSMLGTSTTTTYVESAAGVAQGGRSGLTAFAVACCLLIALFFSPLFLSIPAFVCVIMMPLTYSISNGILLGMIAYVLMNLICGKFRKITPAMYILAVLFILKFIFI